MLEMLLLLRLEKHTECMEFESAVFVKLADLPHLLTSAHACNLSMKP